ncbi:MAG: glycosyltransferase, partial [Planctomycetales bacterium]|nr:glycosyltransferase [Planctomycetales bacterium]
MPLSPQSAGSLVSSVPAVVFAPPPLPPAVALPRVLHVINGEHFSGAERVQQLLGKRLEQFGFAAEFACVKPGQFPDLCELREGQVQQVPMQGRFDLRVVSQLADYVCERNIELLHAHTPRTALVTSALARRTGRRWVYHVHSPVARDSTRGLVNLVNGVIERHVLRSCSLLLTVSRSLRREMLRRGVPRSRVKV